MIFMKWDDKYFKFEWSQQIINYDEKMVVAKKLATMVKDGDIIGFGSGSTSFLAVKEIARIVSEENIRILAIPTSQEINMACVSLGIPVASINDYLPDWGFDGADEVSPDKWLIKGRGGAMFNEKLIMKNTPKTYIIVDDSKFVNKLCEKFPIPVECIPAAYKSVVTSLYSIGADTVNLRLAGKSKDGPVITENGNYIIDAFFPSVNSSLESTIKNITGVLESGLFIGYNVEIISI